MTYTSSPGILVNDGGEDGANSAPPPTPVVSAASSIGGSMKPTRCPLRLRLPPSFGGDFFFPCQRRTPPALGGVHSSFPSHLPPSFGGYYSTCGLVDGGRREIHTPSPRLTSFTPLWGFFFPASLTTTGVACNLRAAPFYFFFIPPCWGMPFSRNVVGVEAVCDPLTVSLSLHLSLHCWGHLFLIYK